MKIILCSDNFFFAQGAAALLQSAGHETWDFFYHPEKALPDDPNEEFTLIVDTSERKRLRQLFSRLEGRSLRIFFITDELFYKNDLSGLVQGVIARKVDAQGLLAALDEEKAGVKPLEFLLTIQQRKVLQYLLRGIPPGMVARLMNISVKTVSAHKRKVLMNLGLKKMNARAFSCLGDFFYKSLLISEHHRPKKSKHFVNQAVY
ncbi:MAG: LuxR C-terminal-related transcriptional regulator [Mixta calida]|nr:LuxR C-terminal-related transcriptional regulator [Mixta calida]